MRRTTIYPHRSVRSLPITRARIIAGIATALALSAAVRAVGSTLLEAHEQLCEVLLRLVAVPILDRSTESVFSIFHPITIPVTRTPAVELNFAQLAVFGLVTVGLLITYRLVPLARNFVVFVLILLLTSAAAIWFLPSPPLTSLTFSLIWLRGEVLVWVVLPLVTATLFVPIMSWPKALGSIFGVQIFAFLWSAARLTFCLGVLHFTGAIFLPVLWFCLGVLMDFLYIVVAYSIALHYAANRWGERRLWQY